MTQSKGVFTNELNVQDHQPVPITPAWMSFSILAAREGLLITF